MRVLNGNSKIITGLLFRETRVIKYLAQPYCTYFISEQFCFYYQYSSNVSPVSGDGCLTARSLYCLTIFALSSAKYATYRKQKNILQQDFKLIHS